MNPLISLARPLLFLALLLAGCAPDAPETPAPETTSTEAEVVATGAFADKTDQQTSGSYRIERADGDLRLVLSDDFKTTEGPDLHVVLSPTPADSAGNENATAEGALVVSLLDSLAGRQVFDLEDDLALSGFKSVLVHCIKYSHLYGGAPLSQ